MNGQVGPELGIRQLLCIALKKTKIRWGGSKRIRITDMEVFIKTQ